MALSPASRGKPPTGTSPQPAENLAKKRRRDSDEKIAERAIKFMPPSLPRNPQRSVPELQIMPPTPKKARPETPRARPVIPTLDFPDPFITFLDYTINEERVPTKISMKYAYASGDKVHTLIAQASSKSCGATAFLMLYTDLVRAGMLFELSQDFWTSYANSYLDDMHSCLERAKLTNMHAQGYKLTSEFLQNPPENNLIRLGQLLQESGFPIILSITHPTLGGHWIVLDAIVETSFHIRDPKSGKAFKIPHATMLIYFDEEIGEKCLYIIKKDDMDIDDLPKA
jgi:hypothetical protein